MPENEENPVTNGLVALVAVAVVVGVLGAVGAVTATRVLGLSDASDAAADSSEGTGDSLYMPDPIRTTEAPGPLVTLIPTDDGSESGGASERASETESTVDPDESKSPDGDEITLSQGAFEVAPGEQLYISGIYPGGEGTVLDIEYRSEGGPWAEFPLDVNVSNETFSTYVETYRTGPISWRVVDKAKGLKSNEIKVRFTG